MPPEADLYRREHKEILITLKDLHNSGPILLARRRIENLLKNIEDITDESGLEYSQFILSRIFEFQFQTDWFIIYSRAAREGQIFFKHQFLNYKKIGFDITIVLLSGDCEEV